MTTEPASSRTDLVPDAVYLNGNVITVDDKFTTAQAFSIRVGRFGVVGSNEHVKATVGTATTVIDLAGKTVLPGFIDTHAHTVFRGAGRAGQAVAGTTVSTPRTRRKLPLLRGRDHNRRTRRRKRRPQPTLATGLVKW